jgi:gliding motility-associated-like protein
VTGLDGCFSDTARKTITVGDYPVADFEIFDTCFGISPRIEDHSATLIGTLSEWNWNLDGVNVSVSQVPQMQNLLPGAHELELSVKSNIGCASPVAKRNFIIKPAPIVAADAINGCTNRPVLLSGRQIDNYTAITSWNWQDESGLSLAQQSPTMIFNQPGLYNMQLSAIGDNGCASNTAKLSLNINKAVAFAGNDTVIVKNEPFQLHASGGIDYFWSPALGLSDAHSANPVAILQDDISYSLSITTAEGCKAEDVINIKVFKGSGILVPGAFTPDNDGLNDRLRPRYIGIKTLQYFSIYNRWGQMIFSTRDIAAGWDGYFRGLKQSGGVYVWEIKATDYVGKNYDLKGTVSLIR